MLCSNCNKPIARSRAQNDYWWVCMTILANEIGYTKEQISILIKNHFKWYTEFVNKKTGEVLKEYQSSANWNKKEFSENTEHLLRFAWEHGIQIQTPEEFFNN